VAFSSGSVINYSYAADGTKLRESRTVSGTTTTTDYTGDLVLENGTRSRLLFDGGYVSVSNSAYHFFITDHLGSVRVVANTSGTAEQYNHYYPLGGSITQYSTSASLQPLKFQGKEWGAGKGLNLYDFGARRYDPATGRWLSQDPLAEKYYAHSPYLFCAGNPLFFKDDGGADIVLAGINKSSVTIATDLIDVHMNISRLGVDWGGNYHLQGDRVLSTALDIAGYFDQSGVSDAAKLTRIGKDIRVLNDAFSALDTGSKWTKNLRSNMVRELGKIGKVAPDGMHAHHVFQREFRKAGIDINNPKYGQRHDSIMKAGQISLRVIQTQQLKK